MSMNNQAIKAYRVLCILPLLVAGLRNTQLSSAEARADNAPQQATNSSLVSCSSSYPLWYWDSNSFGAALICSLNAPQAGYVFISATGSLHVYDHDYEANMRIGIDNLIGEADTDRFVNIYKKTIGGTLESYALSVLKPISAGQHTFYLLGERIGGTGIIAMADPTLSVIFLPSISETVLACGASGDWEWETTSDSYEIIRECSLSVPQDGWVLISADGSVGRVDEYEFEALFSLGSSETQRWVNVYNISEGWEERTIAGSILKPVTSGTNKFIFQGYRSAGEGIVRVYDPTLSVIYFPASLASVQTCGVAGGSTWTSGSSNWSVIHQCSFHVPKIGLAFMSANGTVAWHDGDYEGTFRVGIDDSSGNPSTDRYINIESDSDNGTDKSVAVSILQPITAETHTFYFVGSQYSGAGTVRVEKPTLSVITFNTEVSQVFLPLVLR